ncbi:hypothetical protein Ocin01_16150 [Orchesella cincta]|uniref:F-box domain-containing protein n=1 Tax=Orchesella cincta TaxID=48709 RepID=A0A1D2MC92_ORCCI|nr:hypothetical protein Ocin01_16150 [Orchesella cincta]
MSEVFPLISHTLSRQDVLNSRLVCSSWKDSVEDHLQNHPSQFNVVRSFYLVDEVVNPRLLHSPNDLIPRNLNFSWQSWRHENLLSNVPEGCTNPFLNRDISYSEMGCYFENERRAVFTQILERFGSQIWHCQSAMRILEEGSSTNANTLYQLTRSFLLLMPNLKSLDLHFEVSGGSRIDKSEYLMTPEKEELIRSRPLPPLNDLITLKLRGLINPLESAVWQHYGHVQKMRLEKEKLYSPLFQDSLENVHMDRLEELHVGPGTLEDFRRLRNMSVNSPWPLRTLSLDFSIITEDGFELVFRTISHFGATLRHLGMRLDSRFPTSLESLDLPHLETLKLRKRSCSDKGFISSLGFLQPCASLKILELSSICQYSLDSLAPLLLCPLRTLRLELDVDKDLWMALATVSQLGATLRHLELNGQYFTELSSTNRRTHSYPSIDRLTAQTLALPRLETLNIRCVRLVVDSLDFIQECTSLRKLVLKALHTDQIRGSECNKVIQFRGYFARMNESNIWISLPDLEMFELNMRANAPDYKHHEPVPDGFVQDCGVHHIYTRNGYSDVLPPRDPFY